jgi:ankyrin repeat protein
VKVLIGHGASVDLSTTSRATLLFMAVQKGYLEIVKVLLENGAVIEKLVGGVTPLFMAVQKGYLEIVRVLLEHGATAAPIIFTFAADDGYFSI